MDLEQLAPQLGLASLIVLVVYRVVVLFLDKWGKVQEARMLEEGRRTEAMAAGFGAIAASITRFAEDDIKSHGALAERVSRFEGKLDEIVRRATPPAGYPVQAAPAPSGGFRMPTDPGNG